MAMMTGGQAVVDALRAEGVDTVFGIVGTHNYPIFDAIYGRRDVRLVVPRHEQGGAFMADGYARASGRLAACVTVPGPGLTNAMTGMGQAYSDSSPMLVVSAVTGGVAPQSPETKIRSRNAHRPAERSASRGRIG